MELQVAFDVREYSQLKKVMEQIRPYVDILEVGTLLIKSQGIGIVEKAKKDYGLPVFADIKCMDAGKAETEMAAEMGADYITVLGTSYTRNIKDVIKLCKERKIKSVVDSINCPIDRIVYIQDLGIDVVELHTGYINEVGERSWDDIEELQEHATKPIFMSGGMSSVNMEGMRKYCKKIAAVVVGRALILSKDPKAEAAKIKDIMSTF